MRLSFVLVLGCVLMVLVGCAEIFFPPTKTEPVPDVPSLSTYEKAVSLAENERYLEALAAFNAFLREADGDAQLDAALLNVGLIYRTIGRNREAKAVLSRMIREYPNSPLVADALLEILSIEAEEGRFTAVIEKGVAYTASTDPNIPRSPFFMLIANACEAIGAHLDAARYAYRAWNTATTAEQADAAWQRFVETAEQLDAASIGTLITEAKHPNVQSMLLFKQGTAFLLEERYDEAVTALQRFVDRYPGHSGHDEAQELLLSLQARSRFSPYTVGCVLPLTGAYKVYGHRALNGIEMALIQWDALGDGIAFQLFIQDSQSDADQAIKAVEALDRQRVGAVLGPLITSKAAASTAQDRGIPIFVFTQREGIPDIGPYVFRNFITPRMQARSLVSFAVEERGINRFAIFFPQEKYGRRYMNLFWDEVIAYEGVVTAVEAYDPQSTDFAEPVKKLAGVHYDVPDFLAVEGVPRVPYPVVYLTVNPDLIDSKRIEDPVERISGLPLNRSTIERLGWRARDVADHWDPLIDFDAVFVPDAPKKAGLVIPQLAFYDIRDVLLMGTNLWNSRELMDMSADYMQDVLIVDGFFAESESKNVQRFVTGFEQVYGRRPGIIEAMAYDNAMIVFESMCTAATDSRRTLKEALLQIVDYDGITGRTAFLTNGEAQKALQLIGFDGNRFVPIEPSAASE